MGWLCVRQAIIGKWGNVREKAPSTSSDLVGVLFIRRPRSFSYLALSDARYGEFGKAPSTSSDLVEVLFIRRPRSFLYLALSDARYGEFGKVPSTSSDPVGVL